MLKWLSLDLLKKLDFFKAKATRGQFRNFVLEISLPMGYGKSLIYAIMPSIFDRLQGSVF